MTQKSELGRAGEDFACEYLVKNGYKIVERNFRRSFGELDIIAVSKDKTLVFIEVKTLRQAQGRQEDCLRPEDEMTVAKIKKFKRIAQFYAGENEKLILDKKGWRLDLIALVVSNAEPLTNKENNFLLKHYENI